MPRASIPNRTNEFDSVINVERRQLAAIIRHGELRPLIQEDLMAGNDINFVAVQAFDQGGQVAGRSGGVGDGVDAVIHERLALGIRKRLGGPAQNDVRIYALAIG